MGTAKDFMSENPNVEIKIQLVADADMPTKVRTALTANGVETFAMPNMQFHGSWQMVLQQKSYPQHLGRIQYKKL